MSVTHGRFSPLFYVKSTANLEPAAPGANPINIFKRQDFHRDLNKNIKLFCL